MNPDARGWRIALVADALLNPPHGAATLAAAVEALETHGYGLLQLPPDGDYGDAGLLLAVIADQVAEYAHHGYAVVAVGLRGEREAGLWWRRLTALLRHRATATPLRHLVAPGGEAAAEGQRLAAFLAAYDLPEHEQRRWRT